MRHFTPVELFPMLSEGFESVDDRPFIGLGRVRTLGGLQEDLMSATGKAEATLGSDDAQAKVSAFADIHLNFGDSKDSKESAFSQWFQETEGDTLSRAAYGYYKLNAGFATLLKKVSSLLYKYIEKAKYPTELVVAYFIAKELNKLLGDLYSYSIPIGFKTISFADLLDADSKAAIQTFYDDMRTIEASSKKRAAELKAQGAEMVTFQFGPLEGVIDVDVFLKLAVQEAAEEAKKQLTASGGGQGAFKVSTGTQKDLLPEWGEMPQPKSGGGKSNVRLRTDQGVDPRGAKGTDLRVSDLQLTEAQKAAVEAYNAQPVSVLKTETNTDTATTPPEEKKSNTALIVGGVAVAGIVGYLIYANSQKAAAVKANPYRRHRRRF